MFQRFFAVLSFTPYGFTRGLNCFLSALTQFLVFINSLIDRFLYYLRYLILFIYFFIVFMAEASHEAEAAMERYYNAEEPPVDVDHGLSAVCDFCDHRICSICGKSHCVFKKGRCTYIGLNRFNLDGSGRPCECNAIAYGMIFCRRCGSAVCKWCKKRRCRRVADQCKYDGFSWHNLDGTGFGCVCNFTSRQP